MVKRSPATVTKPVRALGAAAHDLITERHEPDKPRGLRPDLWGTAGEIPAVYPALRGGDGRLFAADGGLVDCRTHAHRTGHRCTRHGHRPPATTEPHWRPADDFAF